MLAQSVAWLASPWSSQTLMSIGRPPSPPWYWLIHSAVASATGVSSLWSTVGVLPLLITPIFTGVPLATFLVPSTLAAEPTLAPAGPSWRRTPCRRGRAWRAERRRVRHDGASHERSSFPPCAERELGCDPVLNFTDGRESSHPTRRSSGRPVEVATVVLSEVSRYTARAIVGKTSSSSRWPSAYQADGTVAHELHDDRDVAGVAGVVDSRAPAARPVRERVEHPRAHAEALRTVARPGGRRRACRGCAATARTRTASSAGARRGGSRRARAVSTSALDVQVDPALDGRDDHFVACARDCFARCVGKSL